MATAHYSCGCWHARCCRPPAGKTGSHCGKQRNRCAFPKGTPVPAKGTAAPEPVKERGKPGPKPGTKPNVSPVTLRRRRERRNKGQEGGNSK